MRAGTKAMRRFTATRRRRDHDRGPRLRAYDPVVVDTGDVIGLDRHTMRMLAVPETRYAESADGVQLAYQVWGEGPLDLVAGRGGSVPVVMRGEEPKMRSFLARLGRFSRNIWSDGRGVGSSDAVTLTAAPTLDAWMDDRAAVTAAAGSERAAALALGEA